MTRQPGDLLHPGRMTQDQLDSLKSEIAPHAFDSQYQQRPRFGGSRLCLIERLARYDKAPAFEHDPQLGYRRNRRRNVGLHQMGLGTERSRT